MNAPFSFSSSAMLFQLFKSLTSLTTSGSLFNPAEKKIKKFSYLDDIVAHQKIKKNCDNLTKVSIFVLG